MSTFTLNIDLIPDGMAQG